MIQAPHGRAPAVATGVKKPDILFYLPGDGDLAAMAQLRLFMPPRVKT